MIATGAVALGILQGACAPKAQFATYQGGACDGFPRPEYQIKGKTVYDQKWADKTTEAGVQGCNWPRPEQRPESLDAKPSVAKVVYKAPVKVAKPAWYDSIWYPKNWK